MDTDGCDDLPIRHVMKSEKDQFIYQKIERAEDDLNMMRTTIFAHQGYIRRLNLRAKQFENYLRNGK